LGQKFQNYLLSLPGHLLIGGDHHLPIVNIHVMPLLGIYKPLFRLPSRPVLLTLSHMPMVLAVTCEFCICI